MRAIKDITSLQTVYVVDEEGISKIFSYFKQSLVLQHHVTLIYFSSKENFIFDRELDILQKRYPTQFILYKVKGIPLDASTTLQELLEAVINSNTKDRLMFILTGDEELIYIVSNQLWFLGVDEKQIKSIF